MVYKMHMHVCMSGWFVTPGSGIYIYMCIFVPGVDHRAGPKSGQSAFEQFCVLMHIYAYMYYICIYENSKLLQALCPDFGACAVAMKI